MAQWEAVEGKAQLRLRAPPTPATCFLRGLGDGLSLRCLICLKKKISSPLPQQQVKSLSWAEVEGGEHACGSKCCFLPLPGPLGSAVPLGCSAGDWALGVSTCKMGIQ